MGESKKSAKAAPIADVAHPGKSAPADNSRSIIISRPIMQDPMVMPTEPKENSPKTVRKSNVIQPLSDLTDPTADEAEPATKDQPQAPEAASEESQKESEAAADEPSPAAAERAKQAGEEAEKAQQLEHETKLQKIIDSKKYFLQINAIEQRRSARFVALGIALSLLLGLAWVNIALDAGLIQIDGVKPMTHFFST